MTEPLEALLQRVQAATGADPQLDRDIAIDLRDWSGYVQTPSRNIHEKMLAYTGTVREPKLAVAMWPEPVTASIDAALALVGRLLPGWVCETLGEDAAGRIGEMQGMGWTAEFSDGLTTAQGQAPTLPLAILAALLTALVTRNKGTDQ